METKEVEIQTCFRENDTQTAAFDLFQPPSWMFVDVDAWIYEEKFGFRRRSHQEQVLDEGRPIFGRDKAVVPVRMFPLVFPNRVMPEWPMPKLDELVEHRSFVEPFKSLLLPELTELEPCLKTTVSVEEWLQGDFLAMTDAYARRATRATKSKSLARAVPRQRHYSVQVGKHRRVLTPRCDPSLVIKLERLTAIILFQRCLRGRAAQLEILETRNRCISLYDELNELEEYEEEDDPELLKRDPHWNAKCVVGKCLSNWIEDSVIPDFFCVRRGPLRSSCIN